jgi:hypothetical protein
MHVSATQLVMDADEWSDTVGASSPAWPQTYNAVIMRPCPRADYGAQPLELSINPKTRRASHIPCLARTLGK